MTATPDAPAPVRFDTKVAVVLREGLEPWQELNVTSFLMSGIAVSEHGLTGEPYRDADGTEFITLNATEAVHFYWDLASSGYNEINAVGGANVSFAATPCHGTAEIFVKPAILYNAEPGTVRLLESFTVR